MATAKKEILGPAHYGYNVETTAGFLAAFDDQVQRVVRDKGWCSQGISYAYQWSGIPMPDQRNAGHPLAGIKLDWIVLSDAGKAELARVEAEEAAKLPKYREMALGAIIHALSNAGAHGRTFGQTDANTVCDALGLPRLTPVRSYVGTVGMNNQWNFRTPAILTTEQHEQLLRAVNDAVGTALAAVPGIKVDRPGTMYIHAENRAARTWGLPGDGEPDTEAAVAE